MKFSTRTRYGLRFLVYLSIHSGNSFVQLNEVAEKENISIKYLEQIARLLKPSGILRSSRGAKGGYSLSRDPSEIRLDIIFEFLEGDLAPVSCLSPGMNCDREKDCPTLPLWKDLGELLRNHLHGITLNDLIADYLSRDSGEMYYI